MASTCTKASIKRPLVGVCLVVVTVIIMLQVEFLKSSYNYRVNVFRGLMEVPRCYDSTHEIETFIPEMYEFVAFKQKPGWHVKFPLKHFCKNLGVSVYVRHAEKASEIDGASMVIFSTGPFQLKEWETLRKHRSHGQIWIFATQEPASTVPDFLPPKDYRYDTYNWSFTFHSASNIHGAYGWYTPYSDSLHEHDNETWFKDRPKSVAWVSSRHCGGLGWDRTKFVKDLGRYIPIDMYGTCGNLALRKNIAVSRDVFRKYKFHLSLENSCCSEYLTEKVWNALEMWQSVPIVLGGTKEEYEQFMPPHSYIHADNFTSLKALANYIKKVGENDVLYNQYFHWRQLGVVKQQSYDYRYPVSQAGACKVVEKLEELKQNYNRSTVDSFDPYGPNWFGSCYRCGNNDWIQAYNFWWRRTIFSKEWEDNRTLYWLDSAT